MDLYSITNFLSRLKVLKGLEFLHEKGLYLGNLHSGNIILSSETAKIINVTGLAGGQSSRLRGLAVRVKVSKIEVTSPHLSLTAGSEVCPVS